ncbi:MAG: LacI family DNA-binding transcriptional regulator [Opitutales bacterium]
MSARVTIRDLARLSGFSRSTVARALKDDPATAASTRDRVKALAQRMNYRPDPVLSHIGARAWRRPREASRASLAYIYASDDQTAPKMDQTLAEELQRLGEASGYGLETVNLHAGKETPEAIARRLYHRGIRGVVFSASTRWDMRPPMPLERFAVIAMGLGHSPEGIDVVRRDTIRLEEKTWTEVLKRGYRRIGFVLMPHPDRPLADAENHAFIHYLLHSKRYPKDCRPLTYDLSPDATPGQRQQLAEWVRSQDLEVILGFNSGICGILKAEGIDIPGQIAFASSRVVRQNSRVTGFSPGVPELAREVLHQLDKKLRLGLFGRPETPKRLLISPPWNEGETLPWRVAPIAGADAGRTA